MEPGTVAIKDTKSLFTVFIYEFCGAALITYAFNFSDEKSLARATAYFVGWMFAITVSGAHFNPATSLAVYLVESRYCENLKYLLTAIFA
jgi:glycerol uptake facilitator-like aquaporin